MKQQLNEQAALERQINLQNLKKEKEELLKRLEEIDDLLTDTSKKAKGKGKAKK